jgi:hypothetical protein
MKAEQKQESDEAHKSVEEDRKMLLQVIVRKLAAQFQPCKGMESLTVSYLSPRIFSCTRPPLCVS